MIIPKLEIRTGPHITLLVEAIGEGIHLVNESVILMALFTKENAPVWMV